MTRATDEHNRLTAQQQNPSDLARLLEQSVGSHVVDKTGLTGKYDFTLDCSSAGLSGPMGPSRYQPNEDSPAPDLLKALEQQLGLKMAKATVPPDLLVIDHVDKVPTED